MINWNIYQFIWWITLHFSTSLRTNRLDSLFVFEKSWEEKFNKKNIWMISLFSSLIFPFEIKHFVPWKWSIFPWKYPHSKENLVTFANCWSWRNTIFTVIKLNHHPWRILMNVKWFLTYVFFGIVFFSILMVVWMTWWMVNGSQLTEMTWQGDLLPLVSLSFALVRFCVCGNLRVMEHWLLQHLYS